LPGYPYFLARPGYVVILSWKYLNEAGFSFVCWYTHFLFPFVCQILYIKNKTFPVICQAVNFVENPFSGLFFLIRYFAFIGLFKLTTVAKMEFIH